MLSYEELVEVALSIPNALGDVHSRGWQGLDGLIAVSENASTDRGDLVLRARQIGERLLIDRVQPPTIGTSRRPTSAKRPIPAQVAS